MSIFKNLWEIIKDVLPILKSAAEEAFEKLPKDKQQEIINISKLVEVIKKSQGQPIGVVQANIEQYAGLTVPEAENVLVTYLKQKGTEAGSFTEAVNLIWKDASQRTESGVKSLWLGIVNLASEVVASVDWQALVLGLGEFAYRKYVKGKINL